MKAATRQAATFLALFAGPWLLAPATEGATCSSYDDDASVARSLPGACEYNTYVCCWTGSDGPSGMDDNADICRVLDHPFSGDVLELPGESEGSVYCHGFAWPDNADPSSYILPLYHHVKNVDRTSEGGYYGNVEGVPECGCLEDMPIIDNAACSTFTDYEGIQPCLQNELRKEYNRKLDEPKGPMEFNLVKKCDNEDAPEFDFGTCNYNTYMCCWTEKEVGDVKDNTDVCRVGNTEYPGESEGLVHCHGFVWREDATDTYIELLAQRVEVYNHGSLGSGYFGNLEGAPQCACIEDMPIVSEADCTQYRDEAEGTFERCSGNKLRRRYEREYPNGVLPNLVGECES